MRHQTIHDKYHTEISPVMLIPGLNYLMHHVSIPKLPCEITFSMWQYLPTKENLSSGIKMYYTLTNDPTETEYYILIYINKYGAFAGMNNIKFYKDYDQIITY